eukprot:1941228-Prorocentrum_lima.AAC.1
MLRQAPRASLPQSAPIGQTPQQQDATMKAPGGFLTMSEAFDAGCGHTISKEEFNRLKKIHALSRDTPILAT